ncbi:MAG: anaerobic glycerol-3-phosphate dehydrogenase subunit B [Gammaproteobacteria bacterium]|nr:anaerobic glycerol-3-phosphate dehydrogenase subunit B [Gammaproteobacteria bacterium]
MIKQTRQYKTRLAVIGSGLAGFAASIFALDRNIPCTQIGNTGAIAYTTGYLDLFGSHQHQLLNSPWEGLDRLRESEPDHPLSRITKKEIQTAFSQFVQTITEMGISYTPAGDHNLYALSPAGTVKPTLSVPRTMLPGVDAKKNNTKTLIIDFAGLQGFSAKEFVANFSNTWPQLSASTLTFPGMEGGSQIFTEVMARALEVPAHREQFAKRIKAVVDDAELVGMPAIMGIHKPDHVHAELERLVGLPLFEIPTIPPSVPGIRLREMFEQAFPARGLTLVPQQKVERLELNNKNATLYLHDNFGKVVIEAETVILATGRFLSGGLQAGRHSVRENLLDIPVIQPEHREDWYQAHYFDPRGHPINRSGIEVDDSFRPLNSHGKPISKHLFAAGILLAHQDWVRQRCGAGIAIASAYKAVEAASRALSSTSGS